MTDKQLFRLYAKDRVVSLINFAAVTIPKSSWWKLVDGFEATLVPMDIVKIRKLYAK